MNKIVEVNSIFSIIYLGRWTKSATMNSYKLSDIDGNYAGYKVYWNITKRIKKLTGMSYWMNY